MENIVSYQGKQLSQSESILFIRYMVIIKPSEKFLTYIVTCD